MALPAIDNHGYCPCYDVSIRAPKDEPHGVDDRGRVTPASILVPPRPWELSTTFFCSGSEDVMYRFRVFSFEKRMHRGLNAMCFETETCEG